MDIYEIQPIPFPVLDFGVAVPSVSDDEAEGGGEGLSETETGSGHLLAKIDLVLVSLDRIGACLERINSNLEQALGLAHYYLFADNQEVAPTSEAASESTEGDEGEGEVVITTTTSSTQTTNEEVNDAKDSQ